jgi:Phage lysozyme
VADAPDPCPPLTAAGMAFIAQREVTNARRYEQQFRKPCFPGGKSGITIGIGYDLRFVDREGLIADWGAVLSEAMIDCLAGVVKRQGAKELLTDLATVDVPLSSAMQVFAKRSLPEFLKKTRSIYPQVDELTSAQRTALVSLVYNRGTDLDGDRRREMKTIQNLLAARKLDDVPEQFLSMTRLWDPAEAAGLITRRQDEAALWRSGFAAVHLE